MIYLKPGVRVTSLAPQIVLAIAVAEGIWNELGSTLTVTSVCDGRHSRTSLHYVGHAVDLRTKTLSHDQKRMAATKLRESLGQDYDVILEGLGTENEHVHVEFQPKAPGSGMTWVPERYA